MVTRRNNLLICIAEVVVHEHLQEPACVCARGATSWEHEAMLRQAPIEPYKPRGR